jgi:hypothetical protein
MTLLSRLIEIKLKMLWKVFLKEVIQYWAYPLIEINVLNMDMYANRKIKITNNALTGKEIFCLYEKNNKQQTKKHR